MIRGALTSRSPRNHQVRMVSTANRRAPKNHRHKLLTKPIQLFSLQCHHGDKPQPNPHRLLGPFVLEPFPLLKGGNRWLPTARHQPVILVAGWLFFGQLLFQLLSRFHLQLLSFLLRCALVVELLWQVMAEATGPQFMWLMGAMVIDGYKTVPATRF